MQTTVPSPAFLRKRKFLLMLPLLVFPFITLLFFLLGGGQRNPVHETDKSTGLNQQLPDAHFNKKKETDKLGLYEAVGLDSAKRRDVLQNDSYRMGNASQLDSMSFGHSQALKDLLDKTESGFSEEGVEKKLNGSSSNQDPENREREIREKLSRLRSIVQPKPAEHIPEFTNATIYNPREEKTPGLSREMNAKNSGDPELSQLDKMLDKLMVIQHPETIPDSVRRASERKETVYRMEAAGGENAVRAIIPEKQTLVSGATIRLQLSEPVCIAGLTLSTDQFIYGTAVLNNERLHVQVRSIRVGNNILPVSLDIYDLDGMEGIYVPGSISREVSKQSLDQGISGLGLTVLDPSMAAQAASAGVQAAKTLISRKVKLVQVTIPGDYQVFLKNAY